MIHVAIGSKGLNDNNSHGRIFQSYVRKINSYGWEVTLRDNTKDVEMALNKEVVIFLAFISENKPFIIKPTSTKISYIETLLKRRCKEFYRVVTKDRLAIEMQACTAKSTLHGCYITMDKSEEILKNALRRKIITV